MCARQFLLAMLATLALNACVDLESKWRWNGISVEDEAAIRAALRKITNSPIVELQPRNLELPYDTVYFYTQDENVYSAQKVRGKWRVWKRTAAVY